MSRNRDTNRVIGPAVAHDRRDVWIDLIKKIGIGALYGHPATKATAAIERFARNDIYDTTQRAVDGRCRWRLDNLQRLDEIGRKVAEIHTPISKLGRENGASIDECPRRVWTQTTDGNEATLTKGAGTTVNLNTSDASKRFGDVLVWELPDVFGRNSVDDLIAIELCTAGIG